MKLQKYDKNNKKHVEALEYFYYSGHPCVSIIDYTSPHNNENVFEADIEFKEYLLEKFPELNLDFDCGNGSELQINENKKSATLTTEWDIEPYTIIQFDFEGELMYYTSSHSNGICFQVDPSTIKYKFLDVE